MLQRAKFFGNGERVLDVGCGPGYLAEHLTKQKNCTVIGVEQDPRLAEIARRACAEVYEVNLETEGLRQIRGSSRPFSSETSSSTSETRRNCCGRHPTCSRSAEE